MLCDAVAADRRANPRDDIMTALVQAEIDGERLDDAELNLFFITLIVAGNETTRNLINHSMLSIIEHPDQAQRLRDDPALWDTAVDEMLRYGSSIHNFRRTATRDTEVRGVPIKEGDKVVLYYASANRDEEVFEDPHRFDVGRTPNDHVTFGGGGVHYCLGASLARAEIKATMRQLVERLPDLELAGRARTACTPTSSTASRRCPSASHRPPPRRLQVRTPTCAPSSATTSASSSRSSPSPTAATSSSRSARPAASACSAPSASRPSSSRSSSTGSTSTSATTPTASTSSSPTSTRAWTPTCPPRTSPRCSRTWSPRSTSTSGASCCSTTASRCPTRVTTTPCSSSAGPRPRRPPRSRSRCATRR